MTNEEFFDAVRKEFDGKVVVAPLDIKPEDLDKCPWTAEEIAAYPEQAWIVGDLCPVCGAELWGLFGSFEWGVVYGIGHCSSCREAVIRYYHYITDGKAPLKAFALVGF